MGFSLADFLSGRYYRNLMYSGAGTIADLVGISEADQKEMLNDLSGIPIIGDLLMADQRHEKVEDYLNNSGMDWSDVKYPVLLDAGQYNLYSSARSTTNFVSKNIDRLYK